MYKHDLLYYLNVHVYLCENGADRTVMCLKFIDKKNQATALDVTDFLFFFFFSERGLNNPNPKPESSKFRQRLSKHCWSGRCDFRPPLNSPRALKHIRGWMLYAHSQEPREDSTEPSGRTPVQGEARASRRVPPPLGAGGRSAEQTPGGVRGGAGGQT